MSTIQNIAVIMTVFNRKNKTLSCLRAVAQTLKACTKDIGVHVFLTDDGSTDGTTEAILENEYPFKVHILKGTGSLYWNGGMNHSWQAALEYDLFDGFLWLNDDTVMTESLWEELFYSEIYSLAKYGKKGIYVGSTKDPNSGNFTYGGFNYTNIWTLKDSFVIPDEKNVQPCQCAHGNITYISKEVVDDMGILHSGYIHGGGDHDYTYKAWKSGIPVLVMRRYVGLCENDHKEDGYADFLRMPLRNRIAYLKSPFGFNLHNTMLFQKRCFPHRYLLVGCMGYVKALFPNFYFSVYNWLRK